jgi:hypothetical protein
LLLTQTSELRPDAIPDFHFWFVILLFASALATAIWLSIVSKHFEVGSSGYITWSPTLPLLALVIAMFWLPTFLYAYRANKALASMASEEAAGRGYLYMERVASFFGAAEHYERFGGQLDITPIEAPELFSSAFVRSEATRAAPSIEVFASNPIRGVLLNLLRSKLPACADLLMSKSKTSTMDALRQEYSHRADSAQTEEERENIRRERAAELDRNEASFESHLRSFRECVDKSIAETNINREVIAQGFKLAQQNAYLIYYANKGFGANSSDYLQFVGRSDFAAVGLSPFLGDITILAGACWMIFFLSVFYRGMEYAGSAAAVSAAFNSLFYAMILGLAFSIFGLSSTIQQSTSNTLTVDTLASLLHWPSLIVVFFVAMAALRTRLTSSTFKSRSAVLIAYVCLPIALEIESLNAINTFSAFDYSGGTCPSGGGWIQIQCMAYGVWQPLVKALGSRVAYVLNWQQFWNDAGARITVSIVVSVLLSIPATWFLLVLLKREFVRPRRA